MEEEGVGSVQGSVVGRRREEEKKKRKKKQERERKKTEMADDVEAMGVRIGRGRRR